MRPYPQWESARRRRLRRACRYRRGPKARGGAASDQWGPSPQVVAARGYGVADDRVAGDTEGDAATWNLRGVRQYLGMIADTLMRFRREGKGLTQKQREHVVSLIGLMLLRLPDPVPRILAQRVRRELHAAEIALPPALIGRLTPCARAPHDVGAATALLVSMGCDRVGHCRRLEIDVWGETKAQICTPMRAAPEVAMQVERAIGFAVSAGLLKTPRVVCWWDLPAESLAIEGPSLGLAVVAALWSAAHRVALPYTWAFTGQLGPMGLGVEAVAGLYLKLKAADAAGCTDVVLPAANHDPRLAELFPGLRLWWVSDASEVVSLLTRHRDAFVNEARGLEGAPRARSGTPRPPTPRFATSPDLPAVMLGMWVVAMASLLVGLVVGATVWSGGTERTTRDVEGAGVPAAPVELDAAPTWRARGSPR